MTSTDRPTASRSTLVAVAVPLAVLAAAVAVQCLLLGDLPDRVAIHWNLAGRPDGWAPAWSVPLMTAGFGGALVATLGVPVAHAVHRGERGPTYRLLAAVSAGVAMPLAILLTGTLWPQTGGGEVRILPLLFAALALATAAGVLGWWVQPAQRAPETRHSVPPLPLAAGEQPVWLETATADRTPVAILGGAILATALGALLGWAAGAAWPVLVGLAAAALVCLVVAATTLAYRVRVAADGLTVTSLAGLPRFHVPIGEISAVRVDDDVAPIGRYGGYGVRMTAGTTAVIVRRGPAIVVDRAGGRSFAVVVDDAATGAALLTAYAQLR